MWGTKEGNKRAVLLADEDDKKTILSPPILNEPSKQTSDSQMQLKTFERTDLPKSQCLKRLEAFEDFTYSRLDPTT
jgi:hypothetical protein